jgi:flagellar basal-body rod modification protein FlgD
MSTVSSVLNNQQTSGASTPANSTSNTDSLTSEQTFLKILVAQIQNQDPTSPTDPTQFVSQLTQYSELEQLIGINTGVQNLESTDTSKSTTGTNPTT